MTEFLQLDLCSSGHSWAFLLLMEAVMHAYHLVYTLGLLASCTGCLLGSRVSAECHTRLVL